MSCARVVTVAGDPDREAAVAAALNDRDEVEVVLRCVDRVEMLAAARGAAVDAVLIVGIPGWLDRQCVDECARAAIRTILSSAPGDETDRLRDWGVILVPHDAPVDRLVRACVAVDAPPPPPVSTQPSTPRGKLVAFWGSKGSPGTTTLAYETAVQLAAAEPETLLIDGDPYGGDLVQLAGVVEELPTIIWAAQMAAKEELDAARLAADLRRLGEHGPVFLPGLPHAELWPEVSEFGWRQLLVVARAAFRFAVCDVGFCLEPDPSPYPGAGAGRNRLARATVAGADKIVAVCRADPIGMKNFLWSFSLLRSLADVDDIYIVANRVRPGQEREIGDLLRGHLGKRPVAYVPDRPVECDRSVRTATPVGRIKGGSDISSAVRGLAAALGADIRARGLLTRLAGRR
ncbi:MAG: CpaE family protein [Actinomycetota bacterium]